MCVAVLSVFVALCEPLFSGCCFKMRTGRLRLGQSAPGGQRPLNMLARPSKTTVEIPDDLFRRAKLLTAQEGISLTRSEMLGH